MKEFSEATLQKLNVNGEYYVYALVDPRNDKVFYIGKGTENRVFWHKKESDKNPESENEKIRMIKEIENSGQQVKHILINWGLDEKEAFASEASLINLMNYISDISLSNIVAGHHTEGCLEAEEIEKIYGAEQLNIEDIKHKIFVVKVNKRYARHMCNKEIYETVRAAWAADIQNAEKTEYVFGVYHNLIVACYKPDRWDVISEKNIERLPMHIREDKDLQTYIKKKRVFFESDNIDKLDENQIFYLGKSVENIEKIKHLQGHGYINIKNE